MHDPDRIAALERAVFRQRLALAAIAACALLVGFAPSWLGPVEASAFRLIDDQGATRAALHMVDGKPRLDFVVDAPGPAASAGPRTAAEDGWIVVRGPNGDVASRTPHLWRPEDSPVGGMARSSLKHEPVLDGSLMRVLHRHFLLPADHRLTDDEIRAMIAAMQHGGRFFFDLSRGPVTVATDEGAWKEYQMDPTSRERLLSAGRLLEISDPLRSVRYEATVVFMPIFTEVRDEKTGRDLCASPFDLRPAF